jgi:hypothetical protein
MRASVGGSSVQAAASFWRPAALPISNLDRRVGHCGHRRGDRLSAVLHSLLDVDHLKRLVER